MKETKSQILEFNNARKTKKRLRRRLLKFIRDNFDLCYDHWLYWWMREKRIRGYLYDISDDNLVDVCNHILSKLDLITSGSLKGRVVELEGKPSQKFYVECEDRKARSIFVAGLDSFTESYWVSRDLVKNVRLKK